jgi:tRNA dimethylallyltransferase
MSRSETLPPLVAILGPTAVGKTMLSLQVAEQMNAEIVSADSRLFYRGMDIGTAKPTPRELERVPHHLIDIADPDEVWSLGRFQKQARIIIADIQQRGRLPLCVGGTGQYIRAITDGWQVPELREIPKLRRALSQWAEEIGNEGLHQRLSMLDPKAVEKIDPRNVRRTIRALEVIFSTGRRFSEQRSRAPLPYRILQIGLTMPRQDLFDRVDQRIDAMMEIGFLEEVRKLLEKYPPDLRSFSAIGYSQLIDHLQGKYSLEEAVDEIKRLTKKFVRRQYTWFKPTDSQIYWLEMGEDTPGQAMAIISGFLKA